jgi:chemotaxis protein CheX
MITPEDLSALTRSAFEVLLELPLSDEPGDGVPVRWAAITIDGAFTGDVTIGLTEGVARRAAQVLLDLPDVADDDVTGTVLELANIVGGTTKALLPAPCQLGLPRSGAAEGGVVCEVAASSGGEPVVVRLSVREPRGSHVQPV